MSNTVLEGEALAQACARIAREMKAEEVEILDLRGISSIADFFVLASANSMPHLRALSREVVARVTEEGGPKPTYREGVAESSWLVLDYIDVMVHVFQREKREFYDLGRLWKDAKRLDGPIGSTEPGELTPSLARTEGEDFDADDLEVEELDDEDLDAEGFDDEDLDAEDFDDEFGDDAEDESGDEFEDADGSDQGLLEGAGNGSDPVAKNSAKDRRNSAGESA